LGRPLPFEKRKAKLARLLARINVGIALNEHTETEGATVFRQACAMGLEGIVSKRLTAPYRSGPSRALLDSGDSAAWACGHGAWKMFDGYGNDGVC
jgi:ATP-dependent DNA ligase